MRNLIPSITLAAAVALAAATLAEAVDGVIEINQARALAGGVTAGDAPDFPVTISSAGSYRLTGNLEDVNSNVSTIVISSDDVTLDLNGFSISCVTRGIGGACGSGNTGINADAEQSGITVRNGVLSGVGGYGMFLLGTHNTVENVKIFSAGRDGLAIGSHCLVDKVVATGSGADGIDITDWCSVTNSVVDENAEMGIEGGSGARIAGTLARANGGGGIAVGSHAVLQGNVAHGNTGNGISAAGVVMRNVANNNTGTGVLANSSVVASNEANNNNVGITAGPAIIIGNFASGNTSYGLNAPLQGAYIDNTFTANNAANAEVNGGIELGQNLCNGVSTCP